MHARFAPIVEMQVMNESAIAGLVLGGLFAAPFAAMLVARIPARLLLIVVGLLISAISVFNLVKALG